jgi:TolB-like protein/Flp pilus assembly protein TadD
LPVSYGKNATLKNFFSELKRRNVYKVAVAYTIVGWLLVQVATQVFPFLEIPNWIVRLVIALVAIGFPIALVIAWAFEITPQGLERTEVADTMQAAAGQKKNAWIYVVVIGAAISVALFFLGRYTAQSPEGGRPPAAAGSLPQKSIAVLPFDNLSEEKGNAYFAEGIQDEILTRLAKVADLKVISRTSTQHFKSAPDNLPQIAKQLGVMHILEGSVQKANDQVRVNVQLINALTDAHLWADTFDRKLTDIFAVETEIAKTIADTLQAKLTGSEKNAISKKPTENPAAHELYLQGRYFWSKRSAANLRKSIDYFNQAIAQDPNYALAYAGLAQAWMVLPAYNGGAPVECKPHAEAAARKALSLDETLSDAVAVLASIKAEYDFDFPEARAEYERAIQLNPNDATARHWFSTDCLATTGDHVGELAEMQRAAELDPLSLVINTNLGNAYLHNNRLDEAIALFRKAIEMDPNFYFAQWSYGQALMLQKKIPEAIAQFEKAASITDDPIPLAMLGLAYGVNGRKDDAQKILAKLVESRAQRFTPAYSLALVCIGLGDHDQAINWLEESYREHDGNNIAAIRIDPSLAPLHGNPRFEAIAEKIVPAAQFKSATASK